MMSLWFGPHTSNTGLIEVFDEGADVRPGVISPNEFQGLVLTKMARKDVVVLEIEDTKLEIVHIGNVDSIIEKQESRIVNWPVTFQIGKVCSSCQVW